MHRRALWFTVLKVSSDVDQLLVAEAFRMILYVKVGALCRRVALRVDDVWPGDALLLPPNHLMDLPVKRPATASLILRPTEVRPGRRVFLVIAIVAIPCWWRTTFRRRWRHAFAAPMGSRRQDLWQGRPRW